eukprot:scaffold138000_cov60-Cyclotella_meneghiniana.AAC.1
MSRNKDIETQFWRRRDEDRCNLAVLLVPQMSVLVQEMIEVYIPVDDDGSDTTRKRVTEEFMACKWTHIFGQPLPEADNFEQLETNNKAFGVKFVKQHAKSSGNVAFWLRWFETFAAHSELYQLIAKPLILMRTVGSIDVERRIKPLKDTILTKKRNRLSDAKAAVLYRARENLNHIMNAKRILGSYGIGLECLLCKILMCRRSKVHRQIEISRPKLDVTTTRAFIPIDHVF